MATATKTPAAETTVKTERKPRKPVDVVARTKTQLSMLALKNKITVEQLAELEAHIAKLTALLS